MPSKNLKIPQKSLTVWDGMGKTRNVQKRESIDIKRSGNMEERRKLYNNNFKSCFPHRPEMLINQASPGFLYLFEMREKQFPKDLEAAYQMGARLSGGKA